MQHLQLTPRARLYAVTDTTILVGGLFLLTATTVWAGAVEALPEAMAITACFSLAALCVLQRTLWASVHEQRLRTETESSLQRRSSKLLLALFSALAIFGLLPLFPLPPWLHRAISPLASGLYAQADQLAGTAPLLRHPLSINPGESGMALLKLVAILAFLLVCHDSFLSWRRTRLAIQSFVVITFILAVLAILQAVSHTGKLLWLRETRHYNIFGPFVNRNHFAAWADLGVLLGLGHLISLRHRRPRQPHRDVEGNLAAATAGSTHLKSRTFLWGFMTVMTAAAVVISLSRGGMLGLLAGLACMSLLLGSRDRFGRRWWVIGFVLCIALVVYWIGSAPVLQRLTTFLQLHEETFEATRRGLAHDTLDIIRGFPLLGSGPGTFATVYPLYQTTTPGMDYAYAHNDWLQLAAEWGLIGALLVVTALVLVLRWMLCLSNLRQNRELLAVSAGAIGALAGLAVHSCVDFSLHITAIALNAAFILAVALKSLTAASQESRAGHRGPPAH